jgi:serine/threonine protein kinase
MEFKNVQLRLEQIFETKVVQIKEDNAVFIIKHPDFRQKLVVKVGYSDIIHEKKINFYVYKNISCHLKKHIVKPLIFNHFDTIFPELRFHVMELVDGISLRQFLNTYTLSNSHILYIRSQLFNIIKGIWKLGVTHNDLHTNNIFINPENLHIKLIDFDLSNRVKPYKNSNNILTWFSQEYPKSLIKSRISSGNPNIWVTGSLYNFNMFAKHNVNLLRRLQFIS